MKAKKISPQALLALEEALSVIFFKKDELKRFIEHTIGEMPIIATIDWQANYKRVSVKEIIDRMHRHPEQYERSLFKLFEMTSNFEDFSHLKYWDEDGKLTKKAIEAIKTLRSYTKGFLDRIVEEEVLEDRKQKLADTLKDKVTQSAKLQELLQQFYSIVGNKNAQRRGYDLEKLLTDLFYLFDLSPKGPFKIVGEQIDGSFTHDHTDFLLEAKWQAEQICASDIYAFAGKIEGKHKLTMGLFIALNGFSKDCIIAIRSNVRCMLLMDGGDLMQVLEGRLTLQELLFIKRRHAADTGEIFHSL